MLIMVKGRDQHHGSVIVNSGAGHDGSIDWSTHPNPQEATRLDRAKFELRTGIHQNDFENQRSRTEGPSNPAEHPKMAAAKDLLLLRSLLPPGRCHPIITFLSSRTRPLILGRALSAFRVIHPPSTSCCSLIPRCHFPRLLAFGTKSSPSDESDDVDFSGLHDSSLSSKPSFPYHMLLCTNCPFAELCSASIAALLSKEMKDPIIVRKVGFAVT